MKKFNLTRILVLVLSLALLIGSVMAISVAADGASAKGEFGGISVAYGEKVAIRVAVDATEEAILNSMLHAKPLKSYNGTEYKSLMEYKSLFEDLLEK